jgi:glycosyltransferase involved in cell wall biosynthesis
VKIIIDARCVFRGKGGIGRYARGLLEALAWSDAPHDFIVLFSSVAPPDDLDLPDRFETFGVPAGMIDKTWEQLHLPTALDQLGADLYFNPTFATPLLARCPCIAVVHDVVFERHPDLVTPGLRSYLARAARSTAKHAHLILTVSEFSKAEICDVYGVGPDRVRVIYNGIDPRFHPMELQPVRAQRLRQELQLPSDAPFLLYVGAIEPKKNVEALLRAYAQVRDRMPHKLVLAGGQGGMAWDPRPAIHELNLGDSVRLSGYVPDERIVELMNAADGFVYPSLYEGFGLPPLEAMACGTPTLVADASSLPEVVGDAALKANPRDVEEMAEALLRLATDEELRSELARKGPQRAGEFTWARAGKELLRIFDQVSGGVEHDDVTTGERRSEVTALTGASDEDPAPGF